jgi:hypothetical protein
LISPGEGGDPGKNDSTQTKKDSPKREDRFTTEDTEGTEEERRGRDRPIDNSTVTRRLVDFIRFSFCPSVSSVSSVVSLFRVASTSVLSATCQRV